MFAQAIRNNFEDIEIVVQPVELEESDIVENSEEIVVQFPIASRVQLGEKLPFFKSILVKLASL